MTIEINVSDDDPDLSRLIETELLKSLRAGAPQAVNAGFVLAARDEGDVLQGGLTASTSYGWLLIKTLWVRAESRRRGVGRSLMREAEERGRALGCHGAWLDTSSADAMRFYEKLGYEPFGVLTNKDDQQPQPHSRWFMKRLF
ncbi:MAG: GNAT family N-acetyltransferase [Inquilinaceae bacterium]